MCHTLTTSWLVYPNHVADQTDDKPLLTTATDGPHGPGRPFPDLAVARPFRFFHNAWSLPG